VTVDDAPRLPVAVARPYMPGYGIAAHDGGSGLLPWSWAADRLTSSHDYWVATVRPEGRPHLTPVWGVWADETLWFSSSPGSRKARNLAVEPRASVATDDPIRPVVADGTIEQVDDSTAVAVFAARVNDKYATSYPVEFFVANACFRLWPTIVFGLDTDDFEGSPTRWTFAAASQGVVDGSADQSQDLRDSER
jgi:PPOX class probable F420-dependent enzyme